MHRLPLPSGSRAPDAITAAFPRPPSRQPQRDAPSCTTFFTPIPAETPPELLRLRSHALRPLNKKNNDKKSALLVQNERLLQLQLKTQSSSLSFHPKSSRVTQVQPQATELSLICSLALPSMVQMKPLTR